MDGKIVCPAARFDREREPPVSPDGHLAYLVADDRNEYPAEVELSGTASSVAPQRAQVLHAGLSQRSHRRFLYSNDTTPPEIYALETALSANPQRTTTRSSPN